MSAEAGVTERAEPEGTGRQLSGVPRSHPACPLPQSVVNDADVTSLQIDENLPGHRREWRVQRASWCVLALLLLMALAGVFGSGPLSHTQLQATDGALQARYDRFVPREEDTQFDVALRPAGGQAQLTLAQQYLSKVQIEQVTPQPERQVVSGDGLTLVFTSRGEQPVNVRISLRPKEFGRLDGWLAGGGSGRVAFRQLVYP